MPTAHPQIHAPHLQPASAATAAHSLQANSAHWESFANPAVQRIATYAQIANGPAPIQRQAAPQGGLPANLKSGIEGLSGIAMDDVRVHYNSSKPAQLQAHAYAQGTDIHIAPGQERHLPHEAWHVVQQKQGRVKPTLQLKGVAINDDSALEREADVMGGRAVGGGWGVANAGAEIQRGSQLSTMQLRIDSSSNGNEVAQLMTLTVLKPGEEPETKDPMAHAKIALLQNEAPILTEAYEFKDRQRTVSDATIPQFTEDKKLLAPIGDEILVINAHGTNGTVAGRTADEFSTLLTNIGAVGYKEIHFYSCHSGMAIFDFDRHISRTQNTKVWAPRGNCTFTPSEGRFVISQMTYSASEQKFVKDPVKTFQEDEGWWCLDKGEVVALGSPKAPKAFKKEVANEPESDETDWSKYMTVSASGDSSTQKQTEEVDE